MEIGARVVGYEPPDPSKWLLLEHVDEVGVQRSNLKLDSFAVSGSRFQDCTFENIEAGTLDLATGMEASRYVDCTFTGLKTRHMHAGNARFERCMFIDVDFHDWRCFSVEMVDCTFAGRLRGGYFHGTVPPDKRSWVGRDRNEFHGNDFSQAVFGDVDFRTGIDLTQQRLPEGDQYLYLPEPAAAIAHVRSEIATWPAGKPLNQAESLLDVMDRDVRAGQHQLFLCPGITRSNRPGRNRALDLLRNYSTKPVT